jgi:hypothetical protein
MSILSPRPLVGCNPPDSFAGQALRTGGALLIGVWVGPRHRNARAVPSWAKQRAYQMRPSASSTTPASCNISRSQLYETWT